MKDVKVLVLSVFLFLAYAPEVRSQPAVKNDNQVEIIRQFKHLYRYQNFFIAGQPSVEELEWLKAQGVKHIINLRTEEENTEVSNTAYDEQAWCKNLGFTYDNIHVPGIAGYTGENLEKLAAAINKGEETMIHCRSGMRANDFFMAYLIKYEGYSADDATSIGRQIRFVLPLEKLLDTKLKISKQ